MRSRSRAGRSRGRTLFAQRFHTAVDSRSITEVPARPEDGGAIDPPHGVDHFSVGPVVDDDDVDGPARGLADGLRPQCELLPRVEGDGDNPQAFGVH